MRYLIALLALLSTVASAQTVLTNTQKVTWSPVTTWDDGTALPTGTAVTYSVYARIGTAAEARVATALTTTTYLTPQYPVKQVNCFVVVANVGGVDADRSPEACGAVLQKKPGQVTIVTVQ